MKNWAKILLTISIFAIISVVIYFVLNHFEITNINKLRRLIQGANNFAKPTFVLVQVLALTLFCFVPALHTSLILLGIILFGAKISFLLSLLATISASLILFFIGDKFGEGLAKKLVGKEDLEKMQNAVEDKSIIIFPVLYIIPFLPDEAICLVAGMTKLKWWYFLIIITICNIIEIGTITFLGGDLIDWSQLTPVTWIVLGIAITIFVYITLKLEKIMKWR